MSDIVPLLRDLADCKHSDLSVAAEAAAEIERLTAEAVRLREALEAVRFNLTQAGYAEDSIMIEGIDAALSQKESTP